MYFTKAPFLFCSADPSMDEDVGHNNEHHNLKRKTAVKGVRGGDFDIQNTEQF